MSNILLDQAKKAAEGVDQTIDASFDFAIPPEGHTTARFVGYVEGGKQPQSAFEGTDKADASSSQTLSRVGSSISVQSNARRSWMH